ncbi:TIGR02678 family protein [Amycolatopsis alkalitolerans]|uniref:TIGR02678 family protein n=1 Tax=Amycolatopsis alkalitolerans TaxID=2547244 RepID=A0A5C4M214_9PSEU|nr:TIGR02678 family protein [Amycolatopsis alkalitolerans]TNC25059.1 TIGR02678 family protein [Amycolatopsis alkalitolerans]
MSDAYDHDEGRRAARLLLRRPMLTAERDGEDFRLVRKHARELTRRFAENLGYRLVVQPRVARLYKAGLGRDATRPLLRRGGDRPFEPRAYALLCLTMAALARCRDQLMMDELVGEVRAAIAEAGVDVDLDYPPDRRALYAALIALVEYGVLHERDHDGGGLERWVSDSRARSLLDVDRDRLRLMLATGVGDAVSPAALLDSAALPSAAGGARVAVRRRLLESPLLTTAELTEEQADWWRRGRNREQERFEELFGVELELRAEGALVIDPEDELSDVAFPGRGTAKQFALLLLEKLADRRTRPVDGAWRRVPVDVVTVELDTLAQEYGTYLNKAHREDRSALLSEVRGMLTAFGLVRLEQSTGDGSSGGEGAWLVHAAASRYRVEVTTVASKSAQVSLFDDPDAPEDGAPQDAAEADEEED